jgi:hypothetical protein
VEVFPLRARAKAASATTALRFGTALLFASVLQNYLGDGHTAAYCFLLFGLLALVMAAVLAACLPETRGNIFLGFVCGSNFNMRTDRVDDARRCGTAVRC